MSTRSKPRIPHALQQIFLKGCSEHGEEIHQPPPGRLAFRSFSNRQLKVDCSSGRSERCLDESSIVSFNSRSTRGSMSPKGKRKVPGNRDAQKDSRSPTRRGRPALYRSASASSSPTGPMDALPIPNPPTFEDEKPCQPQNPQKVLESILKEKGYNTRQFSAIQTAYRSDATALQRVCFHPHFLNMIMLEGQNIEAEIPSLDSISEILDSGVSPDASNSLGQRPVHFLCRLGQHQHIPVLKLLIKYKASVQVADNSGRTPLHEACLRRRPKVSPLPKQLPRRASGNSYCSRGGETEENSLPPCFGIVDIIARIDVGLFLLRDTQGRTPLTYVAKEYWELWNQYLHCRKDKFWPCEQNSQSNSNSFDCKIPPKIRIPRLAALAPNTRPLYSPPQKLSLRHAAKIVSGQVKPGDVTLSQKESNDDFLGSSASTLASHLERNEAVKEPGDDRDDTEEDSFIGCFIRPKGNKDGSVADDSDEYYADTIILGGVPVPTLRYAMTRGDYSFSGTDSFSSRSFLEGSFRSNRRLSECSGVSDIVPSQSSSPGQQIGGETTFEPQSPSVKYGLSHRMQNSVPCSSGLQVPFQHEKSKPDSSSISSGEHTSESGVPSRDQEKLHLAKSLLGEKLGSLEQEQGAFDVQQTAKNIIDFDEELLRFQDRNAASHEPTSANRKQNHGKSSEQSQAHQMQKESCVLDIPGQEFRYEYGVTDASMDLSKVLLATSFSNKGSMRSLVARQATEEELSPDLAEDDEERNDRSLPRRETNDDYKKNNDENGSSGEHLHDSITTANNSVKSFMWFL